MSMLARGMMTMALATLLIAGTAVAQDAGKDAKAPAKVILTVSGNIDAKGKTAVEFDRAALEALGMVEIETSTPWYKGAVKFEGVPLDAVSETASPPLSDSMLRAVLSVQRPIIEARQAAAYFQGAGRWPDARGLASASPASRLDRHLRGRDRTSTRRSAHRLYGAPRRAHRPAEPHTAVRADRDGVRACTSFRRDFRDLLSRSRSVQDSQ